jgi:hypothetical protein
LHVDFYNIVFSGWQRGIHNLDDPAVSATAIGASGFCRPTGFIVHYDAIGPEGYRMLPHFGRANTNLTLNTYYEPSIGGGLPGFSMDNGMEVYLDIAWSSDCVGATNCFDPPNW